MQPAFRELVYILISMIFGGSTTVLFAYLLAKLFNQGMIGTPLVGMFFTALTVFFFISISVFFWKMFNFGKEIEKWF